MTDHADPNHPAIAAILTIDLDALEYDHARIAAALEPHVDAGLELRDWDLDDEWTIAEQAYAVAALICEAVKAPSGKDPWMTCQDLIHRLRRGQDAYRNSVILDRLGEFPGYKLRVRPFLKGTYRIEIYPKEMSTDLTVPILTLDQDITTREIGIAIRAWNAGNSRGRDEGTSHIRRGIRDLLGLDEFV